VKDTEALVYGRGDNNFDDSWTVDLSARWQLQIYKRLDVWLKATVVNVFNNDVLLSNDTRGEAIDDGAGNVSWEPVGICGTGDAQPGRLPDSASLPVHARIGVLTCPRGKP